MSVQDLANALGADVVIDLGLAGRSLSVPEALGLRDWFDARQRNLARIRWMSERATGHGDLLPRELAKAFVDTIADEYTDIVHWLDPS